MAFQGSVVSYPGRGSYGQSGWRGNTSGYIVKDYLESFHKKPSGLFVDPFEGGATSKDVAAEMGISYQGLDLHNGFNILTDSMVDTIGKQAHSVFAHPPYAGMIEYSGNVWGNKAHPDDLSHNESISDFLEKLQVALMNIYSAVEEGGTYAVLMGNWRQKGRYINLSSMTERVACGTLVEEIIKIQHNCVSDRKEYKGRNFIPIRHEKLLVFSKDRKIRSFVDQLVLNERRMTLSNTMSWRAAIRAVFLGKNTMALKDIYKALEGYSEARGTNKNPEAKIRQHLQNVKYFRRVESGVYTNKPDIEAKAA